MLPGRTLTSWPSLQTDIRNAGGTWVDEEVVVCTEGAQHPGEQPQPRRPARLHPHDGRGVRRVRPGWARMSGVTTSRRPQRQPRAAAAAAGPRSAASRCAPGRPRPLPAQPRTTAPSSPRPSSTAPSTRTEVGRRPAAAGAGGRGGPGARGASSGSGCTSRTRRRCRRSPTPWACTRSRSRTPCTPTSGPSWRRTATTRLFVVLKTVRYVDHDEVIETGELMIFVGPHFVVTVRHGEGGDLVGVRDDLEARPGAAGGRARRGALRRGRPGRRRLRPGGRGRRGGRRRDRGPGLRQHPQRHRPSASTSSSAR